MTEHNVVSLELSKKLQEAGYRQEGEFWWVEVFDYDARNKVWKLFYGKDEDDHVNLHIVAPLASELMENISNDDLMDYATGNILTIIDIMRNLDKLAEVYIKSRIKREVKNELPGLTP